jgi:hypothetical protein
MTSDPAKTPLRMTAREFVTCLHVMAASAELVPRKPKRQRYAVVKRDPLFRSAAKCGAGRIEIVVPADSRRSQRAPKKPRYAILETKPISVVSSR